jgi:hypothetical protein
MPGDGSLKAEGDGRQRRSHHHRLDVRPRNRGSIQCVVCLARLGRLKRRRKMTEPWPGLLPLLNWRRNCKHAYLRALGAMEPWEWAKVQCLSVTLYRQEVQKCWRWSQQQLMPSRSG